ncbi:MAG: helix-turn-helix domain-containing protein [Leptonema illini]|uniref:Helix-turn-helix domain-containing protein n=1 Tax=Leptonema illini TaxID=183 RepID=A0A833M0J6_9LEPT|nr:MAG: helix-turn-helix domain-containing protein [Leptonema illini]
MNGITQKRTISQKGERPELPAPRVIFQKLESSTEAKSVPLWQLKPHMQSHIFPMTDHIFQSLTGDIEQRGLLEPIVVNAEHVIFSGHKRIAAVQHLGWKTIPVIYCDYSSGEVLPLIKFNVSAHGADYVTRMRIYETCSPRLLQKGLLPQEFIEKLAAGTGLLARDIQEDREQFLSEEREITVTELKEVWGYRSDRIRINILDSARGTIVQVRSRNFETESGPGNPKEVMRDSYRKACSGLFHHSQRDFAVIGEKITNLRTEMGISQYALAEYLGVSQSYLAECERGRYRSCEDVLVSLQRLIADMAGDA